MKTVFANSVDALNPEVWAQEALLQLENNMVMGNLVHRDFSNEIAAQGDIVNAFRPSSFTARRKAVTDNVTKQNVTPGTVQIPLNQHPHVSFMIRDKEMSLSFKDLVAMHLVPAMRANAQLVDQVLTGQVYRFIPYCSGGLGEMTSSTIQGDIVDAGKLLDDAKAPQWGRSLVLASAAKAYGLKTAIFTEADKAGSTNALREANLGRIFGFDLFMDQNTPAPTLSGATTTAGSLDAAEASGQTILSCTAGGDETINHWITVAGDMCPHMLIATSTGDTNTVWPALRDAALNTAVVTHYTQDAYDTGTLALGTLPVGYDGPITVHNNIFQVGQMVTFGVGATTAALAAALAKYTVVEVDLTNKYIYLDRPLEVAVVDDCKINPGPAGNYNFAFHKNAIALVTRPLALPPQEIGAMSSVVSYNGLSIRATLTYDGNAQGILVTLDLLFGVACLDSTLGVAMLG